MSMDPSNPYSSPPFPGGMQPPTKPVAGMDYMRTVMYVFENPNWFMNCLLGALCTLIPIVGKLVLWGYQYEVAIALIMNGGSRYPDFDFNRFGDYLMRALWPMLVGLVCGLGLIVVLGVLFGIVGVAGKVAGDDIGAIVFGLALLATSVIVPVFAIAVQPMLLRAAFTLDFGQAFQMEWNKDFLRKTWLEMLLGFLFLWMASMVLGPIGLLAFCVGIFLVGPILLLARANLVFQIYTLYLSRGGTPIPIKMTAQPMMMAPPM
jgi:hypothetical protein